MQIIPTTPNVPAYNMLCVLGDKTFSLSFTWNTRDRGWYIDVADDEGTPIAMGLRIVVGTLMMRRCVKANRPNGFFFAVDTNGTNVDPAIDDLGTRVKLLFLSPEDIAAAYAAVV